MLDPALEAKMVPKDLRDRVRMLTDATEAYRKGGAAEENERAAAAAVFWADAVAAYFFGDQSPVSYVEAEAIAELRRRQRLPLK